jgi:hypothetical protein
VLLMDMLMAKVDCGDVSCVLMVRLLVVTVLHSKLATLYIPK